MPVHDFPHLATSVKHFCVLLLKASISQPVILDSRISPSKQPERNVKYLWWKWSNYPRQIVTTVVPGQQLRQKAFQKRTLAYFTTSVTLLLTFHLLHGCWHAWKYFFTICTNEFLWNLFTSPAWCVGAGGFLALMQSAQCYPTLLKIKCWN